MSKFCDGVDNSTLDMLIVPSSVAEKSWQSELSAIVCLGPLYHWSDGYNSKFSGWSNLNAKQGPTVGTMKIAVVKQIKWLQYYTVTALFIGQAPH